MFTTGQQLRYETSVVEDNDGLSDELPNDQLPAVIIQRQELDTIVESTPISVNSQTLEESKTKTIYVITPTYTRPTQMADLTRLSQTLEVASLKHKVKIFWIISEDNDHLNPQVVSLLNRTDVPSVHLLGPRPATHMDKRSGRGVSNRLAALQWLRDTFSNSSQEGVIYFADDDNSYDARIFKEMQDTVKVSVWPVGLIAKIGVSTPIINETGAIQGFHDPFLTRRKFAVDMAGFAADLQFFLNNPKATMPYKVGYEEDFFIRSLGVKISDLEPKANNCTEVINVLEVHCFCHVNCCVFLTPIQQVLVWHTKTQPGVNPSLTNLQKDKSLESTNLPALYQHIIRS